MRPNSHDTTPRSSSDENILGVAAVATAGDVGYALHADRLLRYEAPEWREVALLPSGSANSLWAGDDGLLAAGFGQFVVRGPSGGELSAIAGAPAGDYNAVWSFGADVWLANTVGQLLHFDGQAWDVVDTGTGESLQLWGSTDGVLYFVGDKSFGRWKDGAIELFAQRPAPANMIQLHGHLGQQRQRGLPVGVRSVAARLQVLRRVHAVLRWRRAARVLTRLRCVDR
jgi:hypothetical protein